MKGDFTRSTFRPEKHYSSVRMQQGRVQLDADWNEQVDIAAHRDAIATLDVIGESGGPREAAGFALAPSAAGLAQDQQAAAKRHEPLKPGDLFISAGRYYVDGILCENEHPATLAHQPDGAGDELPNVNGVYLMYLDVWQRHLTALDDPDILEVALGGPDTATRTRTVWQVRWANVEEGATCGSVIPAWEQNTAQSTGTLMARAAPATTPNDPCMLEPGAGYRRLENQLYRVEIHEPGPLGTATFKWSRDNGSVVTAWLGKSGDNLLVRSIGKDKTLGFAGGDCVELTDEARELAGRPGVLVKVASVEGQTITIDPDETVVDFAEFASKPRVRRWDMAGGRAVTVDVPAANDGFIELEDGVEVKFKPGGTRRVTTGSSPARTATGSVEWPTEPQLPHGITHHYCRLGLLTFKGGQYTGIQDCRNLFPSVTELRSLFYVGGDGQEAAPGQTLPQPLQVGVANGRWPVPGATVRFAVTEGTGTLPSGAPSVEVVTDANGIASCAWRLGFATERQQVEATLLDSGNRPVHLPVRFNASFSEDAQDVGIQIEKLLLGDGTSLENDADVAYDRLAKGIDVICSANIAPGTASRATCFLTMEVPFPITGSDTLFWGSNLIGYQPLVLAATARVEGTTMMWRPNAFVTEWIQDDLFTRMSVLNRASRVLTRLTILGNFVWQEGKPEMLLDADAFGMRVAPGALEPTRLRMPSGDGRRGGRLDMWFWVVPPIDIQISPGAVSVRLLADRHVAVLFTVTIDGTENKAAELSVNGVVGGNASDGTIESDRRSPGRMDLQSAAQPIAISNRSCRDGGGHQSGGPHPSGTGAGHAGQWRRANRFRPGCNH